MVLLNYLARKGTESGMVAGLTISVPWDAVKSSNSMEEPLNWLLFNKYLTNGLCRAVTRSHELHFFCQFIWACLGVANSVWRKKSVPYRHRKVLEKVADIDYVLKVWTILYVHICVIVALHTNSCLVFPPFLFHHCHLGTDNPWIWRTLHHFVIWLQNMHGLLPWCQSRQKTAQYSSAHLVSQRWRWPLLSSKQWVKNRWRWTLWSASVFLWKIYDILIHTISHLPHNPHTPTSWNTITAVSCQ